MGLFTHNSKGGIMDVIRCDEKSYLIYKWRPEGAQPGTNTRENTIRWGSPIRVRDGSVAVIVYSGKEGFTQEYLEGPADTILDSKNLPVISSLIGLAYNGGSPFQAEVYFINLAETVQTNFAVPYFDVFDPELPEFSVPVAVRGTVDFNIRNYREFVKKHRLDEFSVSDLQGQIRSAVSETFKRILTNAPETYQIPVIQIERKIGEVKDEAIRLLRDKCEADYGIYLKDVVVAGLEINKDSEGYRELKAVTKDLTAETRKAQTKIGIKDMSAKQKLGVFEKAAGIFVDVKENAYARRKQTQREYAKEYETELAGRVGAAGSKIVGAFGKKSSSGDSSGTAVPPPIPSVSYHVVLFGQSAGPYDMTALKKMSEEGGLTQETLVWTEGMSNWTKAGEVRDLESLFQKNTETVTPPLPPIPGK